MTLPAGWTLRWLLFGHSDSLTRLAWSADGSLVALPSMDGTVSIWDAKTGEVVRTVEHEALVLSVAFSPDGAFLASCVDDRRDPFDRLTVKELSYASLDSLIDAGYDPQADDWEADPFEDAVQPVPMAIRINEMATGALSATLWSERVTTPPVRIEWSPSGQLLITASHDGLGVWDVSSGELLRLSSSETDVTDVCFHGNDEIAAVTWSGVWTISDAEALKLTKRGSQNQTSYLCVASAGNSLLACGGKDGSIAVWNTDEAQLVRTLEGHPGAIRSLSCSHDGRLLASKGADGWVRLWDTESWDVVAELPEPLAANDELASLRFSPTELSLVTLDARGVEARLWELDPTEVLATDERPATTHYANAKIVLVGDTSVGKTGLGLVLAGEPFRPTESTHRRHVWLLDREVVSAEGESEIREVYLWDLAGQPGYRLLHQLHLQEVAVALVLFDAKAEREPFGGVRHWVRALRQAETVDLPRRTIPRLLIAARLDRGGPAVSDERVQQELLDGGFTAFHKTSAKQGWGVVELGDELRALIDWDEMPRVSSTGLFESVKEFLAAQQEQEQLLLSLDTMYRAYCANTAENVTREEFSTCLGRLAARGLVRPLSFGTLVLLQPELLDAYAAALVNAAREQPDAMGSLSEDDVLNARVQIPDDERIGDGELERLLLIACVEDLLRHEVALRENSDDGPMLIFPTQSRREPPPLAVPQQPWAEIQFEGPVQHVYATLAVRLAHSGFFDLRDTYVGATTFEHKGSEGVVGVSIEEPAEGLGMLTLFGAAEVGVTLQRSFEEFVVSHVRRRAMPSSVIVEPTTSCARCGYRVSAELRQQARVLDRAEITCPFCSTAIELGLERNEREADVVVRQMDHEANQQRDRAAARSTVQGKEEVREFDVFLAHNSKDAEAVARLAERLRERALNPWLDDEQVPPGRWFQDVIEAAVPNVRTAAMIVGQYGMGNWEREELRVFLAECAEADTPVIPILLGRKKLPTEFLFLRQRRWISMPSPEDDKALDLLVWGITGEDPRAKYRRRAGGGPGSPFAGPSTAPGEV